jgi:hypothetical protein
MIRYSKDMSSMAQNADLVKAFKAPFAEREPQQEAPPTGLILFSFGRNGGFNKSCDDSTDEESSAA